MALYLKELALFETTTNTVVKLVNVMEGVEGSAVFGYTVEDVPVRINAGQTLNYKQRHTLDIRVVDDAVPATQAILTQWANAPENYRFKAAGYGGGDFLLWDEPVQLTFPRQRDGVATRRMLMTLDAVPGFAGAAGSSKLPVYAGPNLLGIYNLLSGDSQYLNGFGPVGNITATQSGGTQNITALVATPFCGVLQDSIFFPFPNSILTVSANIISYTGGNPSYRIIYRAANGAQLSADSQTITSIGRQSYSFTLPTSTVLLGISFLSDADAGDTLSFNTPALRQAYETAWTP